MVALSLWKVVCFRDFCYYNGWQPCHYEKQSVVKILGTSMDDSLVVIEGSLLLRFLLLQWMVALSLQKIVCCRDFCYSIGLQPCHYGRQFVVEIFVIPIDGNLVIIDCSLLSRFFLLQWMVALSYGRQSVVEIFVTPMHGSLVIMEGCLLYRFL